MGIKLEVGQWYRVIIGKIVQCVHIDKTKSHNKYVLVFPDGSSGFHPAESIDEHLPDCTGFDWKPPQRPEPPAGWRWLGDDEELDTNDHFWPKKNPRIPDYAFSAGSTWKEIKEDGYESLAWGIIRKVAKYRPFANAAEFAPHRDRWVQRLCKVTEGVTGCYHVEAYDDTGVWTSEGQRYTYADMFDEGRLFDDGTPFGVLDE